MSGIRHPFTGALYELVDGTVRVSLEGRSGLFTPEGRWIEGEFREADIHLCGCVAVPRSLGASRGLSSR